MQLRKSDVLQLLCRHIILYLTVHYTQSEVLWLVLHKLNKSLSEYQALSLLRNLLHTEWDGITPATFMGW